MMTKGETYRVKTLLTSVACDEKIDLHVSIQSRKGTSHEKGKKRQFLAQVSKQIKKRGAARRAAANPAAARGREKEVPPHSTVKKSTRRLANEVLGRKNRYIPP